MIRQCAHEPCGEPFEAKRSDARFCSASCRAGASRARRSDVPKTPVAVQTREVPVLDPEIVARLDALEGAVVALGVDVREGDARVARTIADVAEELGQDRNDTNERVCDLEERIIELARRKEPVAAPPRAPRVDGSRAFEARLAKVEMLLRRVRGRLDGLERRVQEMDVAAAAALTMLAAAAE